jgi:hypothetical protein
MEEKEQYKIPNDGTVKLNVHPTGKLEFNITPDFLRQMDYDLEDCKKLITQLHAASKAVFMYAWEKQFHEDLAAYTMGMKIPKAGGQDAEK